MRASLDLQLQLQLLSLILILLINSCNSSGFSSQSQSQSQSQTTTTALIQEVLTSAYSSDKCVLVLPITALGLGNRLRILSGMYAVAAANDCRLIALWKASDTDCAIRFDELFTTLKPITNTDASSSLLTVLSYDDTTSITNFLHQTREAVRDAAVASISPILSSSSANFHLEELYPTNFLIGLPNGAGGSRMYLVFTGGSHAPEGVPCEVSSLFVVKVNADNIGGGGED